MVITVRPHMALLSLWDWADFFSVDCIFRAVYVHSKIEQKVQEFPNTLCPYTGVTSHTIVRS